MRNPRSRSSILHPYPLPLPACVLPFYLSYPFSIYRSLFMYVYLHFYSSPSTRDSDPHGSGSSVGETRYNPRIPDRLIVKTTFIDSRVLEKSLTPASRRLQIGCHDLQGICAVWSLRTRDCTWYTMCVVESWISISMTVPSIDFALIFVSI